MIPRDLRRSLFFPPLKPYGCASLRTSNLSARVESHGVPPPRDDRAPKSFEKRSRFPPRHMSDFPVSWPPLSAPFLSPPVPFDPSPPARVQARSVPFLFVHSSPPPPRRRPFLPLVSLPYLPPIGSFLWFFFFSPPRFHTALFGPVEYCISRDFFPHHGWILMTSTTSFGFPWVPISLEPPLTYPL